jgi:hypothetical protein
MERKFLNQKLGKRNSRRAELEREKNRAANVAAGSRPRGLRPKSNTPPAESE